MKQVEVKASADSAKDTKPNMPEKKFRAGSITATVWKNTAIKDDKPVEYRTISFERNYTDKEGNWQTTNSLRVNDLPKAMLVIGKAYEYLILKETESEYSQ